MLEVAPTEVATAVKLFAAAKNRCALMVMVARPTSSSADATVERRRSRIVTRDRPSKEDRSRHPTRDVKASRSRRPTLNRRKAVRSSPTPIVERRRRSNRRNVDTDRKPVDCEPTAESAVLIERSVRNATPRSELGRLEVVRPHPSEH